MDEQMSKRVIEIIDNYVEDTSFVNGINELIHTLILKRDNVERKINENKTYNLNTLLHFFRNKYQSDIHDDDDKYINDDNLIEDILSKTIKIRLNVKIIGMFWHASNHNIFNVDVTRYNILYKLNNHVIKFHIESEINEHIMVKGIVMIDDWLEYVEIDYGDKLGGMYDYKGLKRYDEEKSELFHNEFDVDNKYENKEFLRFVLRYMFIGVTNGLQNSLNQLFEIKLVPFGVDC